MQLHLHNAEQGRFAPLHLHLIWQSPEQPHLTKSLQLSLTSGMVIQSGFQTFSVSFQPYNEGEGIIGLNMKELDYMPA